MKRITLLATLTHEDGTFENIELDINKDWTITAPNSNGEGSIRLNSPKVKNDIVLGRYFTAK